MKCEFCHEVHHNIVINLNPSRGAEGGGLSLYTHRQLQHKQKLAVSSSLLPSRNAVRAGASGLDIS